MRVDQRVITEMRLAELWDNKPKFAKKERMTLSDFVRQALRGSYVAFGICGLSLTFFIVRFLVPPLYFVPILALWTIYAAYRLSVIIVKSKRGGVANEVIREAQVYWGAAFASCFLAPLLWALIVGYLLSRSSSL